MSEGTWTDVKEKWKEYCVWNIKECERNLDELTHWLATPIICPVLLLHNIPIFQQRSLFLDYPKAGGWNLLQPPVTRYHSTWCHTSKYFNNQCSCENFKCKNTNHDLAALCTCQWHGAVTDSALKLHTFVANDDYIHCIVQSSENWRMATTVAQNMSWHVLV